MCVSLPNANPWRSSGTDKIDNSKLQLLRHENSQFALIRLKLNAAQQSRCATRNDRVLTSHVIECTTWNCSGERDNYCGIWNNNWSERRARECLRGARAAAVSAADSLECRQEGRWYARDDRTGRVPRASAQSGREDKQLHELLH